MAEFLEMGGYAFYVWTSYGLTALLMIGVVIWAALSDRRELSRIARKLRRERRSA